MIFSYLLNMQSHPSWVCGLKLLYREIECQIIRSHPSWVCGLKLESCPLKWIISRSHPSWVCGLKLHNKICYALISTVTPFVGVWIETPF